MTVRADTFLGRVATSARNPQPLLRLRVSPRWARFLLAAGAQPAGRTRYSERMSASDRHSADQRDALRSDLAIPGPVRVAFTAVLGSRQKARTIARDTRPGIALAYALSAELGVILTRAHVKVIASLLLRAKTTALSVIGELQRVSELDLGFAAGTGDGLDVARELDLARAVDHALDRSRQRTNDLTMLLDPGTKSVYHRSRHPRDPLRKRFRSVAYELAFALLDIAGVPRALASELGSASQFSQETGYAPADELNHAHILARELARDFELLVPLCEDLITGLSLVLSGDDLRGADLRDARLTGVDLADVTWSTSTRWPAAWGARIRAASVPVGSGAFRVGRENLRLVEDGGERPTVGDISDDIA
jgi:hypothetical protein